MISVTIPCCNASSNLRMRRRRCERIETAGAGSNLGLRRDVGASQFSRVYEACRHLRMASERLHLNLHLRKISVVRCWSIDGVVD